MKSPPSEAIDIELKTSIELSKRVPSTEKFEILKSSKERIKSVSMTTPTASLRSAIASLPSIINRPIAEQSEDDKPMTVTIDDINSNRSIQMEIEPLETKT
ncbi:hypothetical protein BLA29_014856, partial [Euroglyphus maynei]